MKQLKTDIMKIKDNISKNKINFELFDRYFEVDQNDCDAEDLNLIFNLYAQQVAEFIRICTLISKVAKTDSRSYEIYKEYIKNTIVRSLLRDNSHVVRAGIYARWMQLKEKFSPYDKLTASLITKSLNPSTFPEDPIRVRSESKEDASSISKMDFEALIETLEESYTDVQKGNPLVCTTLTKKIESSDPESVLIETYLKKIKFIDVVLSSENVYFWEQLPKLGIINDTAFSQTNAYKKISFILAAFKLKDFPRFILKVKEFIDVSLIDTSVINKNNDIKKYLSLGDGTIQRDISAAAAFYHQAFIMYIAQKVEKIEELESLYLLSKLDKSKQHTNVFGIEDLFSKLLENVSNVDRNKVNQALSPVDKIAAFNKIFLTLSETHKNELKSLYYSLIPDLIPAERELIGQALCIEKFFNSKNNAASVKSKKTSKESPKNSGSLRLKEITKKLSIFRQEKEKPSIISADEKNSNSETAILKNNPSENIGTPKLPIKNSPLGLTRSNTDPSNTKSRELPDSPSKSSTRILIAKSLSYPQKNSKSEELLISPEETLLNEIESKVNQGKPSFKLIEMLFKKISKFKDDEEFCRRLSSVNNKAIDLAANKLALHDAILFNNISAGELKVRIARDTAVATKLVFSHLFERTKARADTHYIIKDLSKIDSLATADIYSLLYVNKDKVEINIPLKQVDGLTAFLTSLPARKDKFGADKFFEDDIQKAASLIESYRNSEKGKIPNHHYESFVNSNESLINKIQKDISDVAHDPQLLSIRINRYIQIALKAAKNSHAFNAMMNIGVAIRGLAVSNPTFFDDEASLQKKRLDYFFVGYRSGYPNIRDLIFNHVGPATPGLLPFTSLRQLNDIKIDSVSNRPEFMKELNAVLALSNEKQEAYIDNLKSRLSKVNSENETEVTRDEGMPALSLDDIQEIQIIVKSDRIIRDALIRFEEYKSENIILLEQTDASLKQFDLDSISGIPSGELSSYDKKSTKDEAILEATRLIISKSLETVVKNPLYGQAKKLSESQTLSLQEFLKLQPKLPVSDNKIDRGDDAVEIPAPIVSQSVNVEIPKLNLDIVYKSLFPYVDDDLADGEIEKRLLVSPLEPEAAPEEVVEATITSEEEDKSVDIHFVPLISRSSLDPLDMPPFNELAPLTQEDYLNNVNPISNSQIDVDAEHIDQTNKIQPLGTFTSIPPLDLSSLRGKVNETVKFFNLEIERCSPRPVTVRGSSSAKHRAKLSEEMRKKLQLFLPQLAQGADINEIDFSVYSTPRVSARGGMLTNRNKLTPSSSSHYTPRSDKRESSITKVSPKVNITLPIKQIDKNSARKGSSIFNRPTKLKQSTSEKVMTKEKDQTLIKKSFSFNFNTKVSETSETVNTDVSSPLITLPKI